MKQRSLAAFRALQPDTAFDRKPFFDGLYMRALHKFIYAQTVEKTTAAYGSLIDGTLWLFYARRFTRRFETACGRTAKFR